MELLPSTFTGHKRKRGETEEKEEAKPRDGLDSRELILVSSDDSDDDEEEEDEEDEEASLQALVRSGRSVPRLRSTPSPSYATSAVDDGYLEQLARRRMEKKQRKRLRKQAKTAALERGKGQRRSRSEERGGRWSAKAEQGATGGSRLSATSYKKRRDSIPRLRRRHLLVCEDGRVFPTSLLDPSIDGIAHVIMLDLDNWPSQP